MDFETAFSEARQFRMAAALCFEEMEKKHYYPQSQIVPIKAAVYNYACSIELYFKALLIHEGNFKGGHDLYDLFKRLKTETQDEIIKRVGKSPTGITFDSHLKKHSDIYYKWKYTFQMKYKFASFDPLFFKIMGQQVDEMVLAINNTRKKR